MHSILVIEENNTLCSQIIGLMAAQGMRASVAHNGADALTQLVAEEYTAVVASITLPDISGLDLLAAIRQQRNVPVLMLTQEQDGVERILALEMGADDCFDKSSNLRELIARIKAVLRRAEFSNKAISATISLRERQIITVGDILLDPGSRVVSRGEEPIELTSVEFGMLEILLQSAGEIVSRERLSKEVLGRELVAYNRSVDVHVSNIRRKLGPHADSTSRIRTVRGMGYLYTYMATGPSSPRPEFTKHIIKENVQEEDHISCA